MFAVGAHPVRDHGEIGGFARPVAHRVGSYRGCRGMFVVGAHPVRDPGEGRMLRKPVAYRVGS